MINTNRYTRDAVVPRSEVTLLLQQVRTAERRRSTCLTVLILVGILFFFQYVVPLFSLDDKFCRLACEVTEL